MHKQNFLPSAFSLNELYSEEMSSWLRVFMNSGALPLGPSHLLTKPGDFLVSPFTNGAVVAIMGEDSHIRAFHNACPHRGKTIFKIPKMNAWTIKSMTGTIPGIITCGGHSWGFCLNGEKHEHSPGCAGLMSAGEVMNIGNSLWVGTQDELVRVSELPKLPLMQKCGAHALIPDGFRLHTVEIKREGFRPFTGIDKFGDVDHVDDEVHDETLKRVASVADLEIDLSAPSQSVSAQVVRWLRECDPKKMSLTWRRFHEESTSLREEFPDDGSFDRIVWCQESRSGNTYEHFPGMVIESRFAPDPEGPGTMNIVGFYFHENVLAFRTSENDTDEYGDIVHWGPKAYLDLAYEDAHLALEEDLGCMNLVAHGQGGLRDGYYGAHEEGISHQYDNWLAGQWRAFKAKQASVWYGEVQRTSRM